MYQDIIVDNYTISILYNCRLFLGLKIDKNLHKLY